MSTHNDAMADALIEEVKQLRDLVFTICSERDQLQADLAAARTLLLEARGRIWHTCGQPGTTESCLAHRIDAALSGQRREGE